ncbi:MAG: hypothetical protein Kow0056_10030 [Coriobacteriia bacterium]
MSIKVLYLGMFEGIGRVSAKWDCPAAGPNCRIPAARVRERQTTSATAPMKEVLNVRLSRLGYDSDRCLE